MPRLGRFSAALRGLIWQPSARDEVASEIEFHIAMRTRDLMNHGLSAADAEAEARRKFGDRARVDALCTDFAAQRETRMRRIEWLGDLNADIRYALRRVGHAPGFTLAVVLTLGLGVGATTSMFSVVNAVVLRPIPILDAEHVVRIFETNPRTNAFSTSQPNYLDFRDQTHTFSSMAATGGFGANLLDHGDPQPLNGATATASYFTLFGGAPLIGTVFTPEQDTPGGDNKVVLLSEGIWRRMFGADRNVVGQTLNFDGTGYRVMGVMPAGYGYLSADVWVPLAPDRALNRANHQIIAFARLKPGVTIEQAQADISAVAGALAKTYPVSNGKWGARIQAYYDWIVGPGLRRQMLVLFAAVGLVLLMACANIANLLLARASTRSREVSVRAALGAGRWRIVRQLLTESVMYSTLGAVLALVFTYGAVHVITVTDSGNIPRLGETTVDRTVLGFTLLCAVCTGIVFGLVPALQLARTDVQSALRQSARSVSGAGRRLRSGLVVGEIALAMVLLIGAGLLGRSLVQLQHVSLGFQTDHIAQLTLTPPATFTAPQRAQLYESIGTAIAAVPGVTAIGATSISPLGGSNTQSQYSGDGHEGLTDEYIVANWRSVSPTFFATLGIPIKRGQGFDATAKAGQPRVAIIDSALAQRLWPGQDPIGKRVWPAVQPQNSSIVVGVVASVRDQSLASDPAPSVYFPTDQAPFILQTYLIKTNGPLASIIAGVKQALHESAPTTPWPGLQPLAGNIDASLAPQRFTAWLLVAFAAVALVLAAVGIYGIVAFSVAQRTPEIGVRIALGALPSQVMNGVLRESIGLTLAGLTFGTAGAAALSRFLESLLFETPRTDWATYALVGGVLLAVTACASWFPARRAARVDPLEALRSS